MPHAETAPYSLRHRPADLAPPHLTPKSFLLISALDRLIG
jgi:hypothetical protein